MFEVMYNNEFYKVYDVRDTSCDIPDFLIFINYHWVWVSAMYCTPTE